MSFSALAKEYPQTTEQHNFMNPISKINKGLKKARPSFLPPPGPSEPDAKHLTFSSLNKHQPQHSSEVRFKQINTPKSNSRTSASKLPPQHSLNYNRVQRRLFDDTVRDDSKENKMSFANVIRQSREKSLKQSELSKKSSQRVIKSGKNENGLFNKLKTRLMGGKEENRGPSPLKSAWKEKPKELVPRQMELDMVRISMQSELRQMIELDMAPSL